MTMTLSDLRSRARRAAPLPAAFALALLLAGCQAAGGTKSSADNAPPEVRAIERWKLLIAGDTAKAYEYLSPGVRSTKPQPAYAAEMAARPIRWETVELHEPKPVCETADACLVKVLVTYSVDVPLPNVGRVTSPSVQEEKWIELDGVWYHVPADFSGR
jgi:hypothetical protein